jgi:hypothetical protein
VKACYRKEWPEDESEELNARKEQLLPGLYLSLLPCWTESLGMVINYRWV